ncbi:glycosyltransferase [Pseudodesulfovibrio cashew]|nr:glycosyltransferase [Pseudodesulfovibrio cashew]
MRINFLNDGHRNCGGCLQLIKYANLLCDMGHEVFLTYTHSFSFDLIEVKAERVYSPELRGSEVPDCDAVICSSWSMARKLADLPPSKGAKFAYLQDFENWSGTSEGIIGNWRQPVHLIAVARYLVDAARNHASKKAARIPYGIDFDIFRPGNKPPLGEGVVIGGLYNTMPRKRFADLLAVVEAVRGKDVPVKLEIFGAAERPAILPEDAGYLSYPSREALREMMTRCHVWLAMSEQEGLHIPPMEAMACGAVPVCTDIGGMRDYCLDRETGYRVDVGDIDTAAGRIAGLYRDPVLWQGLSGAAVDHIRAMGSDRENAARMVEHFAACQGLAGVDRLFDFTAVNHNTHATLTEYLASAEKQLDRDEKAYADSLVQPVIDFYEEQAVNADHPNVFSRFQDNYGLALCLQNRIYGETRQGFLQRAFRYAPARPGVVGELARAKGCELVDSYQNPARFDGKLRIYLTLACNLHCEYCVNEKTRNVERGRTPAPPEQWIEALNREQRHVVFTGGEPFLYKGLEKVLTGLDPFIAVSIYTNLSFDLREVLAKVNREVRFFVSWHAHQKPDREVFLANIRSIQANPLFSLTVHAIDAHENQHLLEADLAYFRENGVDIELDVDQRDFGGCLQDQPRTALCRRKIFLFDPEGTRYQCVSRLMRADRPMENLFSRSLAEDICVDTCPDYGLCAPCDGLGETVMGVLDHDAPR